MNLFMRPNRTFHVPVQCYRRYGSWASDTTVQYVIAIALANHNDGMINLTMACINEYPSIFSALKLSMKYAGEYAQTALLPWIHHIIQNPFCLVQ